MRIVVGKSITNGRLYFESWVYDNWRDFYTKHVLWTKPVRVFK
jgi:hypothetical protein